jgi:8-oxo-dGTP diphosphatase
MAGAIPQNGCKRARLGPLSRLGGAIAIVREAARLILRRPVAGVAAAARVPDGRWVLIRRADTGTWALPGGTSEWGETTIETLRRELIEEAGAELRSVTRTVGVFSRPDRDSRFHAVTVVVACEVAMPSEPPNNPLEVTEVGLFDDDALPAELALGNGDMLEAARRPSSEPVIE